LPELRPDRVIVLTCNTPVDLKLLGAQFEQHGQRPNNQALREVARLSIAGDLAKLVGDLRLAASLASPGSFEPVASQIFVNGARQRRLRFNRSVLRNALEQSQRIAWPTIVRLPITEVFDWLNALPGFNKGFPKGAAGRAGSA